MKSEKFDVHVVADYICWKFFKLQEDISVTKLQKLLYLTQAWFLARYGRSLFEDDFVAWKFGPVCLAIEERYKNHPNALPLSAKDIDIKRLDEKMQLKYEKHICDVLDSFGELSFLKLEEHFKEYELPWQHARKKAGVGELDKSDIIIPKEEIMQFHKNN